METATNGKAEKPEGNPRLRLWNQVKHTDPQFARPVKVGSREYTSINPHYQTLEATKLWGPYGKEWGLKNCEFRHFVHHNEGMTNSKGNQICRESLALIAEFYCPESSFTIAVDMPFKQDDDCFKKLMTEAQSKALSKLGFSADVFMGQWDDPAYIKDMQIKYGDSQAVVKKALVAIRSAESKKEYDICVERVKGLFTNDSISKGDYNLLMEELDQTQKDLVQSGKL